MHAVDRGPEPQRLERIRQALTPRWVTYYRNRLGPKPADSRWREFQPQLAQAFNFICGYCEELCKGDVDHFRPKSRYPERVYQWSNWVLACHFCNHQKLEQWPAGGYVDPCARRPTEHPECYFDFDTTTAEIVPKATLSDARRRRAVRTINDLDLNSYHHLKRRFQWLTVVAKATEGDSATDPGNQQLIKFVTSREYELSSITRQFLNERGFTLGAEEG